MKCLIVYAHPEEKSFNGSMKNLAVKTLSDQGWEIKVSDLYKMKFKAFADRDDFTGRADPGYLNYIIEQKNASEHKLFAADIRQEQEKVLWADFILFQYPLWWTSVPAILKGWFDRVLATGFAWDFGKMYDQALLKGKKSMVAVTTGGAENFYQPDGPHGVKMEQVLYNVTHGTLYFCGIDVLPSFVAYSVFQAGDEKRQAYLKEYQERLLSLKTTAPIPYHKFSDFDENFRLRK
jgi:NAD(P)H dehydrogenase (quinone)